MRKRPKLNPEVKELWLEALRSKKYSQGKGYLHQNESFCCLGILCDLFINKFSGFGWYVDVNIQQLNVMIMKGPYLDEGDLYEKTVLPREVIEWAFDIEPKSQMVELPRKAKPKHDFYTLPTLALLNDEGFSFKEIANTIEKWL